MMTLFHVCSLLMFNNFLQQLVWQRTSSVNMRILWNGEMLDGYFHQRAVRQNGAITNFLLDQWVLNTGVLSDKVLIALSFLKLSYIT